MSNVTSKIKIGDEWIDVPSEYVQQEAEHCKDVLDSYYMGVPDDVDDVEYARRRQAVIDCRVEFWRKWNDTIPNNNNNENK
jgi:hypothetical protein